MQEQLWDNTYFEGKVRSKNTQVDGFRATLGEIDPGEYTFSTVAEEHMTVLSGQLMVKLSEAVDFSIYGPSQLFVVFANASFTVKADKLVTYQCVYIDAP